MIDMFHMTVKMEKMIYSFLDDSQKHALDCIFDTGICLVISEINASTRAMCLLLW